MCKTLIVRELSVLFIIFFLYLRSVKGFNLSPKFKKIINVTSFPDESHFGFSVLLRSSYGKYSSSIIVSAPRANSKFPNHRGIPNTGLVYQCNIFEKIDSVCYPLTLDPTGNEKVHAANGLSYEHKKEFSKLGFAIDGEDSRGGRFVACAPKWVNQYYEHTYLMNGMCYVLSDTKDANKTALELKPLIDSANQSYNGNSRVYYWYAFAELGFSAHMIQNPFTKKNELLLGAPGMINWKGGIVHYKDVVDRRHINRIYDSVLIPHMYYHKTVSIESYFGYAVSSGNFLSDKDKIFYVASAPREANFKGKVFIFDIMDKDEYNKQELHFTKEFEGGQLGEYFGSAICVIDVTGDDLDDVIVGAPQYSLTKMEGITVGLDIDDIGDEGAVYVFINKDNWRFQKQEKLISLQKHKSRFGTAISSLGDINYDGYKDVVVGAPYEDNGRGAVYIYLGNSKGLGPMYSQRIAALDLSYALKGFGFSVSRGVDIDENKYNDLAVGAYQSEHAVLLKSFPVVDLIGYIRPSIKRINLKNKNFNTRLCFFYSGSFVPHNIDIIIKLTVDPTYKRAIILKNASNIYSDVINISYEEEICQNVTIEIRAHKQDYTKPIELFMSYKLKQDPNEETNFCKKCPVINPNSQMSTSVRVPYATGCEDDTKCITDLRISSSFVNIGDTYVKGSQKTIILNITVVNNRESAFLTEVIVYLPEDLKFVRLPENCEESANKIFITCDIGNLIPSAREKNVLIELDPSKILNDYFELPIHLEAHSSGTNINSRDNNITSILHLKTEAQLNIFGKSKPEYLVYSNIDKKMLLFVQEFEIHNQGPSPVDQSIVQFSFPIAIKPEPGKDLITLFRVAQPIAYLDKQPILCSSRTNFSNDILQNSELDSFDFASISNLNSRQRRWLKHFTNDGDSAYFDEGFIISESNPSSYKYSELTHEDIMDYSIEEEKEMADMGSLPINRTFFLNCSHDEKINIECMEIECNIGLLQAKTSSAKFALHILADVEKFDEILGEKDALLIGTKAIVQPTVPVDNRGGGTHSITLHTTLLGTLPEKPVSIYWLIIAIAVGLLVLILIIFIMMKCGFFKRHTKEELELLKSQDDSLEKNDLQKENMGFNE